MRVRAYALSTTSYYQPPKQQKYYQFNLEAHLQNLKAYENNQLNEDSNYFLSSQGRNEKILIARITTSLLHLKARWPSFSDEQKLQVLNLFHQQLHEACKKADSKLESIFATIFYAVNEEINNVERDIALTADISCFGDIMLRVIP